MDRALSSPLPSRSLHGSTIIFSFESLLRASPYSLVPFQRHPESKSFPKPFVPSFFVAAFRNIMSLFFRASYMHMNIFISACVVILISVSVAANEEAPPNVLIIMTDEQNLRTLGCSRNLMNQSQAEIWGEGIIVSTPNIDSLGKAGALLSNFLPFHHYVPALL